MDRGQAANHHHGPASPAIRVEGHYMQIWCTTYHYNRQWPTIYRQRASQILHRPRHQAHTSFVEHPQTNGQAEATNKVILVELRKRLDTAKGRWPEELIEVLWAYRCTPQSSTNESPFSLVYGTDAMIPVEIGEPSLRRELYDPTHNHQNMALHLDLLPELREKSPNTQSSCQTTIICLRGPSMEKDGKFSANWDGPYRIREDAGGGAYHLEQLSGEEIPNT